MKLTLINPHHRKGKKKYKRNPLFNFFGKKKGKKKRYGKRSKGRKHGYRRYRRNPIGGVVKRTFGTVQSTAVSVLKPATIAAAGALALDAIMPLLPLPVAIRATPHKYLLKAGGAIGLAVVAGKVFGRSAGQALGVGALAVVFYQAGRDLLARNMPTLKLDGNMELAYIASGQNAGMGIYDNTINPRSVAYGDAGGDDFSSAALDGVGEYVES